ncbi:MAG: YHS domain-containing (seleno)protein [Hyphomonas sp.]|uniref:YHS domain-containing (seleno)protein n=1 Tax=Hyphomonas sp. TaxID=87 RepID=UPI0034A0AA30
MLLALIAAAEPAIYAGAFDDLAVQGYDRVAYFTEGKPVKGAKQVSTAWKGAEFRFASAANRDAFKADPETYAPQYAGHCAWAVSQGYTAKGDAKHWKIVDGKLYLNYNTCVQKKWERDVPGFIASANTNWPGLVDQEAGILKCAAREEPPPAPFQFGVSGLGRNGTPGNPVGASAARWAHPVRGVSPCLRASSRVPGAVHGTCEVRPQNP